MRKIGSKIDVNIKKKEIFDKYLGGLEQVMQNKNPSKVYKQLLSLRDEFVDDKNVNRFLSISEISYFRTMFSMNIEFFKTQTKPSKFKNFVKYFVQGMASIHLWFQIFFIKSPQKLEALFFTFLNFYSLLKQRFSSHFRRNW